MLIEPLIKGLMDWDKTINENTNILANAIDSNASKIGVLTTDVEEHSTQLSDVEQQVNAIPNQTYITEKAKTVDVNNALSLKADKTYTDNRNDLKRDKAVKITNVDLDVSTDANKVKLVNLADEVKQAMAGTTPINASVADGSIGTTKYANNSIKWTKLGFGTGMIGCTTEKIDCNINSSGNMLITLTGNGAYKNSFYLYRFDNTLHYSITLDSTVSYTVNNWEKLIWNLDTNTIQAIGGSDNVTENNILLISNIDGNIGDGVLNQIYLQSKIKEHGIILNDLQSYHNSNIMTSIRNVAIAKNTITIDASGTTGYNTLKFWYCKSNSTSVFTCDLVDVTKTYTLHQWEILVWDLIQNNIKVIKYGELMSSYQIVLAVFSVESFTSGYLLDLYSYQKAKTNEDNSVNDAVASYLVSNFKSSFTKLINVNKSNIDICNLGYMTDTHISEYKSDGYKIINSLYKTVGIDTVVSGGDNILYNDKSQSLMEHSKFVKRLKPNLIYAVGNHDLNGWTQSTDNQPISEIITTEELYSIYGKQYSDKYVFGSKTNMYYYYDVPNTDIRIITLNTSDVPIIDSGDGTLKYNAIHIWGIRQEQLAWLANVALNTNRHVLINMHISPISDSEGMYYNSDLLNRLQLRTILEAFKNGTSFNVTSTNDISEYNISLSGNFATTGNLIGVISGHIHLDWNKALNGITYIARNADWSIDWTSPGTNVVPTRTVGTDTELCVDILSIDTTHKKMYITRFGNVGTDLVVNY